MFLKTITLLLNILDSYGDGICCGHGNGYFNLNVVASKFCLEVILNL